MEESNLLAMPDAIQELVAKHVSANSVKDLFNFKRTCKRLKEVSERPSIYAVVNVFHPIVVSVATNEEETFLAECYKHENPFAIYLKGVQDSFLHDRSEKGLAGIKAPAHAGFEPALYTYAMLRKIFWDNEKYIARFSREFVRKISQQLVYLYWTGSLSEKKLPAAYRRKRIEFLNSARTKIYDCDCSSYTHWWSWHFDDMKGPDMCDDCFWTREVERFFYFLAPRSIRNWPDTRRW